MLLVELLEFLSDRAEEARENNCSALEKQCMNVAIGLLTMGVIYNHDRTECLHQCALRHAPGNADWWGCLIACEKKHGPQPQP